MSRSFILYFPFLMAGFLIFGLLWNGIMHACRVRRLWLSLLFIPVYAGLVWSVLVVLNNRSDAAFRQAFGFPPADDVRRLQCHTFTRGNAGGCYMRFFASTATVSTIIESGRFQTGNVPGALPVPAPPPPRQPSWWTTETSPQARVYFTLDTNRETAALTYRLLRFTPHTQEIFYEQSTLGHSSGQE
jgi:hypothetical protein